MNFREAQLNKATVDIRVINETSLAGVSLSLSQQQGDIDSLFLLVAQCFERIEALENKLQNYESHNHNYSDSDGTTSINKTTGGVNP